MYATQQCIALTSASTALARGTAQGEKVTAADKRRKSLARGRGLLEPLLLEDPTAALPPTAQRLLAAARRLLAAGGYEALKLSSIAREAGESKASIGYHFGNKAGLVTALVDSLVHDANRGFVEEIRAMPSGEARVRALMAGESRIAADTEAFQAFFDVLPQALRDPDLRERIAALYDGYRETVRRCLGSSYDIEAAQMRSFAVLMIAIVDGLAIQHRLDPRRRRCRRCHRPVGAPGRSVPDGGGRSRGIREQAAGREGQRRRPADSLHGRELVAGKIGGARLPR